MYGNVKGIEIEDVEIDMPVEVYFGGARRPDAPPVEAPRRARSGLIRQTSISVPLFRRKLEGDVSCAALPTA